MLDDAFVHGAGTVRIDCRVDEDTVTLSVTDDGAGFTGASPQQPDNIGEPDPDGTHGIGLPLARRLVEAMPGRLMMARTGPRPRIDIVLIRPSAD